MSSFVKAARVSDIPVGAMKTVRVSGKRVAIANVDGQFFAIDDTCTHAQCSLGSEGHLEGTIVTCGCHGARFDVTRGEVLALPAPTSVASYQVKVEGEDILIGV